MLPLAQRSAAASLRAELASIVGLRLAAATLQRRLRPRGATPTPPPARDCQL
ncbi:hypothetical protein OAN61_00530 [bacterium]|nr:hypothetical protein [bacterium]